MPSKIVKLKKDELLQKEGEIPASVFIVKAGAIIFNSESQMPSPFLPKDLGVGQVINGLSLFKRFSNTATARASADNTELVEIPFSDLIKDLEGLSQWVKAVIHSIVNQVWDLDHERKSYFTQLQKLRTGDIDADRVFLKMNEALLSSIQLYGIELDDGIQVAFDHIKLCSTFAFEQSGVKMTEYLKALGEAKILSLQEIGNNLRTVIVEDIEVLQEVSKYLYKCLMMSKAHMMNVDKDETVFLDTLTQSCGSLESNTKGVVTLDLASVIESAKKAEPSVSIKTLEKICLKGLQIEQVSLPDRIDIKFIKDEIEEITPIWRVLSKVKTSRALTSTA